MSYLVFSLTLQRFPSRIPCSIPAVVLAGEGMGPGEDGRPNPPKGGACFLPWQGRSVKTEFFDIVDDHDRVIGQAPRSACHGNPALVHRVAHVLVFNSRGELLLQKRGMNKDVQPGKWDTSVGGHLDPGECYIEAARREFQEELGVSGVPLTFLYHSRIRNSFESENVASFLAIYNGPIVFAESEIEEVRFWSAGAIETALGSDMFTPNFEEEWTMFLAWSRRYPARRGEGLGLCGGDSLPNLVAGEVFAGNE